MNRLQRIREFVEEDRKIYRSYRPYYVEDVADLLAVAEAVYGFLNEGNGYKGGSLKDALAPLLEEEP